MCLTPEIFRGKFDTLCAYTPEDFRGNFGLNLSRAAMVKLDGEIGTSLFSLSMERYKKSLKKSWQRFEVKQLSNERARTLK